MKTRLLLPLALLAIVTTACGDRREAAPEPRAMTPPPGTTCLIVDVDGMACGIACPPEVRRQLEAVDGVVMADVSFEKKQAMCYLAQDADKAAVREKLRTALAGRYHATAIHED